MKICITSLGETLDSDIDPRFGRCKYFLIVDTDTMNVESISNESLMASGGAGIQAAQRVSKTGVSTVLTGNIGPNAFQTLNAAGIEVITGVNGIVKDVIEKFNSGDLNKTESPSVGSHFGMGSSNKGLGRGRNL